MIDWTTYREAFPHLPDKIYLNHAAIAPQNTRAYDAVKDLFSQRMEGDIEFWPEVLERKKEFCRHIGRLINGPADHIALVPNTSAGLNILALGLDWKPGDRVLLNDLEFPSNVIPFLNLERLGVEVDFVRHRQGKIAVEDIAANLHPRTRLLSISFVEFLNGFRNDLKSIGEVCRERDVIFSVDGIQGVGALLLDVQDWGIDFLANGGHKWLMWPGGMGFVYISPRIFDRIFPAQAGWLSLEKPLDFFNYRQDFAPGAQRFEPGTINTTGIVAAAATLEMMLEIGPENVENKILQNTDYVIERLQEAGIELFTDTRPGYRSGIVTFFHSRAEELYRYLKERNITVSLREGKIRVSPHFYNHREDLDRFLEAVRHFG